MISMITSKEEFYQRLWLDHFELPEERRNESFIYNYLKQNKDRRAKNTSRSKNTLSEYADKKKRDKYILLKSAYLAYQNSIITETEYIKYFSELAKVKDRKTGEMKLPLKYENLTADKIDNAEKTYEHKFLTGCVSDFFQNIGYRSTKTNGGADYTKSASKYSKEKDGYISDLDMWAAFYLHSLTKSGEDAPQFISELDDEYIAKCKKLYTVLCDDEYSDSFVPLYFDSHSGGGVFVIGSNRFTEERPDSCKVCTVHFGEILDKISENNELTLSMVTTPYDSVEEAFQSFKMDTVNGTFCENYSFENDDLPEGVDTCFNTYFYISKEEMQFRNAVNESHKVKESLAFQLELEAENQRIQRLQQHRI